MLMCCLAWSETYVMVGPGFYLLFLSCVSTEYIEWSINLCSAGCSH